MNLSKKMLITLVTGSAILVQLFSPIHVFADGETPPPVATLEATEPPLITDVPTEVPPTEMPLTVEASTVEPVTTEIPALTSDATEASTELVVQESPIPALTETVVEQEPAPTEEQPTLLETLQEIPNQTSIVVLDENDQALPLATQETADAVADGDPIWCPDGVTPIANTDGCTDSYLTMNDLLTNSAAYINGTNANGTIWITSGNIDDTIPVTIDGSIYTNWANYSLTLQGGWNGTSNSVFNVPISISNWKNTVAIYNIDAPSINISNTTINNGGNILVANSRANVTIDRAKIQGAIGFGLFVNSNGGDVTVKNSTIEDTVPDSTGESYYPYGDGADIFSNGGNVTIENSQFLNNDIFGGEYGAWISTDGTGDLIVKGSTFDGNNVGLSAFSSKDIYIYKDNIFQNNYTGLAYYACSGNLLMESGITFAGNYTDIENWGGCAEPISYGQSVGILGLSTHSSGKFTLDCKGQDGFSVPLPNGDLVQIFCPVSGEAEIARLDNTILPAPLPDGYIYASAFELNILQSQKPIRVINEAGYIRASFVTSNLNSSGNTYSILYWDRTEENWVVLKDYMRDGNGSRSFYLDPEDPTRVDVRRKIISGVQLVSTSKDDRVEVSTNFPGIFVLAQH